MPTPTVIKKWQYSDAIPRIFWDQKYVYEDWTANPLSCAIGGGIPIVIGGTGTNVFQTRFNTFEYNPIGTQVAPDVAPLLITVSDGVSALDVTMTDTAAQGVEICPGILSSNPQAFLTGTDSAFFFRLRFAIETVANISEAAVGFRGVEAYSQTPLASYTDLAAFNVAVGAIDIQTIKGGVVAAPVVTTDTWLDGEVHELKVMVSSAGVVTYQIDGAAPTVTAAYTFTLGLYVVPFFEYIHGDASSVLLLDYECGYQS